MSVLRTFTPSFVNSQHLLNITDWFCWLKYNTALLLTSPSEWLASDPRSPSRLSFFPLAYPTLHAPVLFCFLASPALWQSKGYLCMLFLLCLSTSPIRQWLHQPNSTVHTGLLSPAMTKAPELVSCLDYWQLATQHSAPVPWSLHSVQQSEHIHLFFHRLLSRKKPRSWRRLLEPNITWVLMSRSSPPSSHTDLSASSGALPSDGPRRPCSLI